MITLLMKEPHILYQTEEHIAKIIINRPEAKNAFSPEMITLWREALERCLVNRVVPHEKLMEETMSFAKEIAGKPPLAARMIKRAVYQAQRSDLRSHLDCISSQLALLSETRDHQEAARAFLEKRKPHFIGE